MSMSPLVASSRQPPQRWPNGPMEGGRFVLRRNGAGRGGARAAEAVVAVGRRAARRALPGIVGPARPGPTRLGPARPGAGPPRVRRLGRPALRPPALVGPAAAARRGRDVQLLLQPHSRGAGRSPSVAPSRTPALRRGSLCRGPSALPSLRWLRAGTAGGQHSAGHGPAMGAVRSFCPPSGR